MTSRISVDDVVSGLNVTNGTDPCSILPGDYIPSSPVGNQAEQPSGGVIGLNIVSAGGVGNGSLSSSSPPGTPLSLAQSNQHSQQQQQQPHSFSQLSHDSQLPARSSSSVCVTKMEPMFSVHSPPVSGKLLY